MQTSDKERFIWLRNSLSSCLCPDCEYKVRLRHAALCSPPCVLPLRPPREGAVVHNETRTEDISGTCDDYRAGLWLQGYSDQKVVLTASRKVLRGSRSW